jgi:hypothetical protein
MYVPQTIINWHVPLVLTPAEEENLTAELYPIEMAKL